MDEFESFLVTILSVSLSFQIGAIGGALLKVKGENSVAKCYGNEKLQYRVERKTNETDYVKMKDRGEMPLVITRSGNDENGKFVDASLKMPYTFDFHERYYIDGVREHYALIDPVFAGRTRDGVIYEQNGQKYYVRVDGRLMPYLEGSEIEIYGKAKQEGTHIHITPEVMIIKRNGMSMVVNNTDGHWHYDRKCLESFGNHGISSNSRLMRSREMAFRNRAMISAKATSRSY